MAEKFELEFDDSAINAALQRLETTLQGTDEAFVELQNSSKESMKVLEKAVNDATKPIKELGESVNVSAAQANLYMNRWKDSFKELTDDQRARLKAMIQTNLEFGESVEDVEKKVKGATKSMISENKKLQESVQQTGSSYEKLVDAVKRLNSSLFGALTRVRDFASASLDATKAILGMAGATTKHAKATFASASSMTGLAKGLTIARAGLQLFKVALIATGLGAFAVAIGAVVAYFSTWQEGMDKVTKTMAQFKTAIEVVVDRFAGLGSVIVKFFKGEWEGLVDEARAAMTGWTSDIVEGVKETGNIEDAVVRLRKRIIELTQAQAKLRSGIEEERQISDDANLSYTERIAALEKAIAMNRQMLAIGIEIAEEEAKIAQARADVTTSNDATLLAVEEAHAKVEDIRTAADRAAREDMRKLAGLRKEAAAAAQKQLDDEREAAEKLRKEYDKLGDAIDARYEQAFLDSLDPVDRIIAERDIAIQEVTKTFDLMKLAAEAAGKSLSDEVVDKFEFIVDDINKAASDAVTEAAKESPPVIVEAWGEALDTAEQELQSVLEVWKGKLADLLGLKPEELDLVFDFAREAAGAITDFTAEMTQQRIDMYAAEADALRESRDEIRSELEAERNEQKLGNANRVDELEARLAAEEAALFAAEGRRLEAERKAANQRLVFDSIQQASKLALAAASVINAEAKNGLLGIILAAGGIALLFSIMAGAKANAAKASQIPKLRKGGELRGRSHEEGGIPMFVDGQLVAEAEDGEFVVNRKTTKRHKGFISELNAGKYDHLDRLTVVDPTRQVTSNAFQTGARDHRETMRIVNPTRNPLSGMAQQIRAYETKGVESSEALVAALMEKAYKAAAKDATSELINYWKGRPVVRPLDGYIETWEVGNMKQRKVVKQG